MICMITLRIRNDPHFSSLHSPSSILLPSFRPSFIISFLLLRLSFFAPPSHIFTSHALTPTLTFFSLSSFFIRIPFFSFFDSFSLLYASSFLSASYPVSIPLTYLTFFILLPIVGDSSIFWFPLTPKTLSHTQDSLPHPHTYEEGEDVGCGLVVVWVM